MEKKLTRSIYDRKLSGVFGGLGNYLNIDPTILRLLFAAFTIFNPIFILIYIVAAVIIPTEL
ncbi:hypothetical protein GCM10011351_07190 [Paraliobacillus quinghaiensis]|uniref:Phage shock protein PspC N-terminal domain-containing protein n=1 Tax=Paraliobacillus quinghaiensis TaxID=470815 RepID=A0A917WRQ3_9BACI|nr:PspC domain-containing protein [Paraliobacillus quinghaiensis]GGM23958.1 hypothetical protein GCM10011351_07190 [Paraliobacillus quinghaiensis]